MKQLIPLLAALAIAPPLYADTHAPSAAADSAMSDGVVRRIDAANGKVTLKHGPLANLDMPAMTMVFQVQPRALLDAVKTGDTVKFQVEKISGAYTVAAIQPVQ